MGEKGDYLVIILFVNMISQSSGFRPDTRKDKAIQVNGNDPYEVTCVGVKACECLRLFFFLGTNQGLCIEAFVQPQPCRCIPEGILIA